MKKSLKGAWRRTVRCFLAGVFAVLPLVVTVAIVVWVAAFIQGFIGPETFLGEKLQAFGLRFATNKVSAYAIGWVVVLAAVFIVGVVVEMGAKKIIQRLVDVVLTRVPLVGSIYDTSKQLVNILDKTDQTELKGMSVVFCIFGKEHGTGVLALMPSPQRFRINGRDYHVVIIPTAPVPVGGALLFVPVDSVEPADMSVDGLMSIYMSMGATVPQFLQPKQPSG